MSDKQDRSNPKESFDDAMGRERQAIDAARFDCGLARVDDDSRGLTGLALSGGGIRSATFCLGVLQAIAANRRLRSFDYLSTVSGGGYIGAWLSAWIHRKGLDDVEGALMPHGPAGNRRGEAPEITWLRRYSNYLAPKVGPLSTDSLTLVATWSRNVFLNLVIVVSLLAFLFITARLLLPVANAALTFRTHELGLGAAWLGLFIFPAAISFNLSRINSQNQGRTNWVATTPGVLATVLTPAVTATLLASFSLFAPNNYGLVDHLFDLFLGACSLLGLAGLLWLGWQLLTRQPNLSMLKEAIIFVMAYTVTLVVAYLLAKAFIDIVKPHDDYGQEGATWLAQAAKVLTFGPPCLLLTFGISGSVLVGLVGRCYHEHSREWWGRMNAWLLFIGVAWLFFFALAFYTRPLIDWAWANSAPWAKAVAGTGWIASLLGTLVAPKPTASSLLSRFGAKALDAAATLVVLGFLVAVAYGTATALAHHARAGQSALFPIHSKAQAKELPHQLKATFVDEDEIRRKTLGPAPYECLPDVNPRPRLCTVVETVAVDLPWAAAMACLFCFLLFGRRVNVNKFSLHNLYKNRLIRCYLGASRQEHRVAQPFTGFDDDDDPSLHELRRPLEGDVRSMRPLHIVNTALNITHGTHLAWQERKAASFTLTPFHCGYSLSPSVGDSRKPRDGTARATDALQAYRDTEHYAREYDGRHITLGMAVATSGAAVSPNMGRATTKPLAFVTTLFNVRLGRWSANTNREKWRIASPSYGLFCLLQELFGFANETRNFVYLSDGGHFDNTGIYELVHRGCRTILAVDAGADQERSFGDLANIVRKCRVDFGVDIDINTAQFGHCKADEGKSAGYVIGSIDYHDDRPGQLIVIKPTLIGLISSKRVDVFGYARIEKLFPQQSTLDQFFDESQFESYRALGECIATDCLADPRLELPTPP